MWMESGINPQNYEKFCLQAYTNYKCLSMEEYQSDLARILYLKKILNKYKITKKIDRNKLRLALNHLIVLYNVFRAEQLTQILFYKLDRKLYGILKTFLLFLNFMPALVTGINGKTINSDSIKNDKYIQEMLLNE